MSYKKIKGGVCAPKGFLAAATAAGVAGLFMETHPQPEEALSDGPNAMPLDRMYALLETLLAIDECVKKEDFLEAEFGLGD